MHGPAKVAEVLQLRAEGFGARRIASRTNVPVGTVADWVAGRLPNHSRKLDGTSPLAASCERCGHRVHRFDELPPAYVYLLGLYLGDGCVSAHRREVFRLRIFLDLRYPAIIEECVDAMRTVVPHNKIHRQERRSNYVRRTESSHVEISAFSKQWPCLLPQHGPGKKYQRVIALTAWQQGLVERWPDQLLRGLIHSDGCRFQNIGRSWSWPRYSFSQKSQDIISIFCGACDLMNIHWTRSGEYTIYVSRKADVATLDGFIGPKS